MADKNSRYNPQDDVFQLIDGKRVPVKAYDLRAAQSRPGKKRPDSPSKTKGTGKEADLSLEFNGRMLTLRVDDGKTITRHSVPAVSGKANEDGSFSYDKDRQKIPKVGPIPEGTHQVEVGDVQRIKDTGIANRTLGKIGLGLFPGGERSWGTGRVWITTPEDIQQRNNGRKGFSIHGGAAPGSAGCIDVVDKDERILGLIEKHRGSKTSVPLTVDYSKTPSSVFYKGRKKK